MDTIKLQAFAMVAELRNFSEAARRLNYTQPAISAQVRELENELGVSLFERTGKRIELTAAGRTILPYAGRLLRDFEECRDALPGRTERKSRILRIGASNLPGVHLLPDLLGVAKERFPDMMFTLYIGSNYQIERMLFAKQVDVGFVGRKRVHPPRGQLSEHLVTKDELVAVLSPAHPLASRDEITIDELAGLPLILPPRNILTRRQVEERFHHLGIALEIALELSNAEAIKRLVARDLGISVMCRSAALLEERAGWLVLVPVHGLDLYRSFCLLVLREVGSQAPASRFIEFALGLHGHADPSARADGGT